MALPIQIKSVHQLKKFFFFLINKEIKKIENRAIKACEHIKSFHSKEELENLDTLIKIEQTQEDLYNMVYKPWIEEYDEFKKLING